MPPLWWSRSLFREYAIGPTLKLHRLARPGLLEPHLGETEARHDRLPLLYFPSRQQRSNEFVVPQQIWILHREQEVFASPLGPDPSIVLLGL
jgi:hypothetical protein